MRLHVAAEASSASLMFHFEEPLVCHPTVGVSGKYIEDTIVQIAEDDHGGPHVAGALHRLLADTAELGTSSQERITVKFGLRGGDWTDNTVPTPFTSSVDSIDLGESSRGVSAKGSLIELTFVRRSGSTSERAVLREFGTELDDSVEVRVMDSSADMRYIVLPQRPEGTENMSEEELAKLVTLNSMIGVTKALSPQAVPSAD